MATAAFVPQAARLPPQPKPIKTTPAKEFPYQESRREAEERCRVPRAVCHLDPGRVYACGEFQGRSGGSDAQQHQEFPATIELTRDDGSSKKMDLPIRTRGQVRRSYDICEFAPLRLEFPKDEMKGTAFEGSMRSSSACTAAT